MHSGICCRFNLDFRIRNGASPTDRCDGGAVGTAAAAGVAVALYEDDVLNACADNKHVTFGVVFQIAYRFVIKLLPMIPFLNILVFPRCHRMTKIATDNILVC